MRLVGNNRKVVRARDLRRQGFARCRDNPHAGVGPDFAIGSFTQPKQPDRSVGRYAAHFKRNCRPKILLGHINNGTGTSNLQCPRIGY